MERFYFLAHWHLFFYPSCIQNQTLWIKRKRTATVARVVATARKKMQVTPGKQNNPAHLTKAIVKRVATNDTNGMTPMADQKKIQLKKGQTVFKLIDKCCSSKQHLSISL